MWTPSKIGQVVRFIHSSGLESTSIREQVTIEAITMVGQVPGDAAARVVP